MLTTARSLASRRGPQVGHRGGLEGVPSCLAARWCTAFLERCGGCMAPSWDLQNFRPHLHRNAIRGEMRLRIQTADNEIRCNTAEQHIPQQRRATMHDRGRQQGSRDRWKAHAW